MSNVAVTSRSFSKHHLLRAELSKKYSQINFNDEGKSLKGTELIHFLQDYEMAILGLEQITESVLQHLPKLKVISRFGVGLDTLDLPAIKAKGIRLAYTSGANKRAVAELVIALAINLLRKIPQSNQNLQKGLWQQNKGRQLSQKTFGILGLGAIGKDLVSLLKPFACKIYVFDLINQKEFCENQQIEQVDLNTLLQKSEIVSLHLPLNATTRLILDEKQLALLQPHAILINTARGELVHEGIVKQMLLHNQLGGAAFDVFAAEPPSDQELLSLPNFLATPHIGGSTEEAILAMGKAAIEGLETAELLP